MYKSSLLIFVLLFVVLSAFADVSYFIPSEATQGGYFSVFVRMEETPPYQVTLYDTKGIERSYDKLYPLPNDRSLYYGVLGVDSWWPAGEYKVVIEDEDSFEIFEQTMTIKQKNFLSEDIPLNQKMSNLRTDDSKKRAEESAELWSVISANEESGFYSIGNFAIPLSSYKRHSAFYGDRRVYIYSDGKKATSIHNGLDFAAPVGTPVKACSKGQVVMAQSRIITGNTIIIEHLPGVYSLYYHLDELLCKVGDIVERDSLIGKVGSTGLVTGPHLHFEVRIQTIPVDPLLLFDNPLLDKTQLIHMMRSTKQ
ncbi:M23 family metallopeptidase [Spirochaeta cellobiosiphila]|uniref:M23 family metallopeptidase n=1 Tax=Spirochaeta cellobiosiphila TaxID=504483 RepID=UPI0003FC1EE7|nr:M23 family metallopeptidase [Spirochaeta cellobiosiphila]